MKLSLYHPEGLLSGKLGLFAALEQTHAQIINTESKNHFVLKDVAGTGISTLLISQSQDCKDFLTVARRMVPNI